MRGPRYALRPGSAGFVALIAAIITMTAATIDMNLPAIPATAVALNVSVEAAQLTVPAFFVGLAVAQAFTGPLADRYGRRPILLVGVAGYVLATLGCLFAGSIETLLLARVLQGVFAAVGPVLGRTVVRDLFDGPAMARVMSYVMAAFILAPMVAPTIGATILEVGSWRWIFGFLLLYGGLVLAATHLFFAESLKRPDRGALRFARIAGTWAIVLRHPESLRYGAVAALAMTMLLTYLGTAAPLFMTAMGLSARGFGVLFALIAGCASIGSLANARLVHRFALPVLVRAASALALAAIAAGLLLALMGLATPWTLFPVFGVFFLCFTPIVTNATTLALAPHGDMAGAASSVIGTSQNLIGAPIAALAGLAFDGSVVPALAIMLGLAGLSLLIASSRLSPARDRAPSS